MIKNRRIQVRKKRKVFSDVEFDGQGSGKFIFPKKIYFFFKEQFFLNIPKKYFKNV